MRQNSERAERVIKFIECLTIPSGFGQGESFKLEQFQRDFIYDVYSPEYVTPRGFRRKVRRAILSIARKNGKALALDTPIPTPTGWTTMGNLKVGDIIFDEDGNPTKVTFATPIQHQRNCYEVEFADGSVILADADHQWTVRSRAKHGREVTLTTADMLDDFILPYGRENHNERNYSVTVAGPIKCGKKRLLVDPYVLGVWLGDGASASASITCVDDEIIKNIQDAGYPVKRKSSKNRAQDWSISDGVKHRNKDCLQKDLRAIEVLDNKHIPSNYLRSSIDQRLALLQGLMDTDGYASKAGQCEFVTIRPQLRDDVLELVRSLGMKAALKTDRAKINGKDCGERYRIQFWSYSDFPAFRLSRKVERLKTRPKTSRNFNNYIIDIRPVESVPVRCIQVDSPNSLFLAGRGFTPTHNTALIAALVLAHLIGPEAEQNAEIYSAANDRDQAAIVFKFVAQIVRADPELAEMLKVVDSTKTITCERNGSFYRAISAEAGTKHGLNPTLVIYDELAQAKSRDLYDVLDTSMGGREQPLFITISTQSVDPKHILSELIDDGLNSDDPTIVCHLYEVPIETGEGKNKVEVDIFDEENWYLANPALGKFRSLEDLRAIAAKAARMPAEEPKFRNLFLNQRVDAVAGLISRSDWQGCLGEPVLLEEGEKVYAGLDLSSVNDLTAFVLVSAEDGDRIMPFMWKPESTLKDHSDRDFGKGNHRYKEWYDAGHLEVTPGRTIDKEHIVNRIAEIAQLYDIQGVAYDRWRMDVLMKEFERAELETYRDKTGKDEGSGLRLVDWGQGYKDMAPAVDAFEESVLCNALIHPGNPCLTWCVANAVATTDPSGNRKLDKDKAKFRIDAAVALCQALGLKYRDLNEGRGTYLESSGLLVLS